MCLTESPKILTELVSFVGLSQYASIILSIIDSQEHNWLTGSIIGSWEPMLYYDTCVMELTYIG